MVRIVTTVLRIATHVTHYTQSTFCLTCLYLYALHVRASFLGTLMQRPNYSRNHVTCSCVCVPAPLTRLKIVTGDTRT
jgi:hypothetical protein